VGITGRGGKEGNNRREAWPHSKEFAKSLERLLNQNAQLSGTAGLTRPASRVKFYSKSFYRGTYSRGKM